MHSKCKHSQGKDDKGRLRFKFEQTGLEFNVEISTDVQK